MLISYAAQSDPRFLDRADPAFWHPAYEALLDACPFPQAALGDYVVELTYGPIVTGETPPHDPGGLAIVNQGQVGEAGVDLREAVRVPAGSRWDSPRARLQPFDLVVCRSGVASVARNRLALYLEDAPAVVGSFVDLVRLAGLDPVYAALYLKTCYGWGQIHRLINGVATPNISFGEIRSLRVLLAPPELQQQYREAYLATVLPLHRKRHPEAAAAHRGLVARLQAALGGESTGN